MVRLEIATDITDKKHAEEELKSAKRRAEELARKDDLTELTNRRAFFEQGKLILELARRFCHPVSVIMMDIDHFKAINDNYGHSVGDKVLRAVAVQLQRLVRETDIVARIGGEEFALVLPETSLEHAANLAERLRSEIANLSVTSEGHQVKFTASFGVVNCRDGAKNLDALLTDADDALYVAKKKGRNLVKISP